MQADAVEPWLRATLVEVEPVRRQVLHALELTREDAERWCAPLSTAQLHLQPLGLPSLAFHLRHIVRSLDRLLTYAEGDVLSGEQRAALASETAISGSCEDILREFTEGLTRAAMRVLASMPSQFAELRGVGRERIPVPVAGLLIHCAEHTQRHAGQMVTTAKVIHGLAAAAPIPNLG